MKDITYSIGAVAATVIGMVLAAWGLTLIGLGLNDNDVSSAATRWGALLIIAAASAFAMAYFLIRIRDHAAP